MLVPHSDPEGPQPMEGEILCSVFVFLRKLDGNWRKIEGFVFFFSSVQFCFLLLFWKKANVH
jgi:hypothetical protein